MGFPFFYEFGVLRGAFRDVDGVVLGYFVAVSVNAGDFLLDDITHRLAVGVHESKVVNDHDVVALIGVVNHN